MAPTLFLAHPCMARAFVGEQDCTLSCVFDPDSPVVRLRLRCNKCDGQRLRTSMSLTLQAVGVQVPTLTLAARVMETLVRAHELERCGVKTEQRHLSIKTMHNLEGR